MPLAATAPRVSGRMTFLSFVDDITGAVAQAVERLDAEPPQASAGPTSGKAGGDDFLLDDEKVVWRWTDLGGRVTEDVR